MKILDFLLIISLFFLLGTISYILWMNIPLEPIEYEDYELGYPQVNYGGIQFYPNMRYKNKIITYTISKSCNEDRTLDTKNAFSILSQRTILKFKQTTKGEIKILCSNLAPEPKEEGHFIAGEGGPSEIINTTNYAVILSGKVSLYRKNECEKPNVATHEILHALGFNHNNNKNSILYPITKCKQKIDRYIIDEINKLYADPPYPDLIIKYIKAKKIGRYLDFEITLTNLGLNDSNNSKLGVYIKENLIKEFSLKEIKIGTKKILNVENLIIPRNSDEILFRITSNEKEINSNNNKAKITLKQKN